MSIETETIDKLYLELSQFTQAKTARELLLEHAIHELRKAVHPFVKIVMNSSGVIPTQLLSFSDWHRLTTVYNNPDNQID